MHYQQADLEDDARRQKSNENSNNLSENIGNDRK